MSDGTKKVSLQEAMKQRLAEKKQAQQSNNQLKGNTSTKKLKSQQTKKTSNTRRKMGV